MRLSFLGATVLVLVAGIPSGQGTAAPLPTCSVLLHDSPQPASGSFDETVAQNCFTFAGLNQDIVLFRVTRTTDALTTLSRLYVTRADGAEVPCAGATGLLTCSLDSTGPHNLHVVRYGSQTGAYNVAMLRLASPTVCLPLMYGAPPTQDSISPAGELDCFAIMGAPGTVNLRLTRTSFLDGFVPEAVLYGPDGVVACDPFWTADSYSRDCTITAEGLHTLVVHDYGDHLHDTSGTGGYEVSATIV